MAESRSEQLLPSVPLWLWLYALAFPLVQLPNGVLCVSAPKLFPVAFNLIKSFMDEVTQKKIVILGSKYLDPWPPVRSSPVPVWKAEDAAKGALRLGHPLSTDNGLGLISTQSRLPVPDHGRRARRQAHEYFE